MNKKGSSKFFVSFALIFAMLFSLMGTAAYASALQGDVNNDGAITYRDAEIVLNYARNSEFDGAQKYDFTNADMDGDSLITATDAAKIMASSAGLPAEKTLYIFGDSTGCDYSADTDVTYYYKRVGFGTKLKDCFVDSLTVKNYAVSGESSLSFAKEGRTDEPGVYYNDYLANVSEGDFVIIAFGHNDEKTEEARYTDPIGGINDEGSFKNSLYTRYIKPAADKGANVILCTPVVRRKTGTAWSDGNLHIANGGDYSQCIRELGEELNIPVIDNTLLTKNLYEEVGNDETLYFHAWTKSKKTSVDNTHLNSYGASMVAYMMCNEILNSSSPLKDYVKLDLPKPTKESTLFVNPDYVESVSSGEVEKSEVWTTIEDPWYGSVFGDVGGQAKITNGSFNVEQLTTEGALSFNIRAGNPPDTAVGKIASTSDGIAAVFQPVDAGVNFSISATAKVNGILNTNNQVAFGAIVLDSVGETDVYETGSTWDYVAASPLYMANAASVATDENPYNLYLGYARLKGTLTGVGILNGSVEEKQAALPNVGDEIPVKITKVGNKYTVEYNGVVNTIEADFSGTVYVGLYASRCADITFTDVVYTNEVQESN